MYWRAVSLLPMSVSALTSRHENSFQLLPEPVVAGPRDDLAEERLRWPARLIRPVIASRYRW